MKGIVSKSTGSWYKVFVDGKELDARLRGKIRTLELRSTNPVTVGDIVQLETEGENMVITDIEERRNCIVRKSNKLSKQYQLIASNIDLAILIITPGQPFTPLGFIDRYLVTASAYSIPVHILINKKDLEKKKFIQYREQLLDLYTGIGYHCESVSFHDPNDIEKIRLLLAHKTCLLSGNSGVGKSSLINALQPELNQKIGTISSSYHKGKHTTTFAQMFSLDKDSFIIDTPGIKDFGLIHMEREHLAHYFPEMQERMNQCKFNNCIHLEEPECAILAAVENGDIAESRYLNYVMMLEEIEEQSNN